VRILLASASPRRAELLAAAGFVFDIVPTVVDERPLDGEEAESHVVRLASAKSRAVDVPDPGTVVIGADTVVVVDGVILGKPADDAEAAAMLRALSGRAHHVLTGVSVRRAGLERSGVARSLVTFAELDPEEIAWYVASGEPRDKAGAYGVQGLASRFVERVEGSYSNVVGLPVALVYRLLRQLGLEATG
jgi:septum formation protein